MALEAVVFPVDTFGFGADSFWGYDLGLQHEDQPLLAILDHHTNMFELEHQMSHGLMQENIWDPNSSSPDQTETCAVYNQSDDHAPLERRRKRRCTKSSKNKEELEKQRMTHIVVERNRRKQMNDYLTVLRSFMPSSYVQRGDQASIVGGAITFVKELEQLLQTMEAHKGRETDNNGSMIASPFSQFFTFPQYTAQCKTSPSSSTSSSCSASRSSESQRWSMADIEVTMVETHAHLKILSKKRPKQLLKMVAAFQTLRLTILHLNVTTSVDHMVLYSVSVKVEEGCRLNTVEEIAAAVNEMLGRIQEETALNY